MQFQTLLLIAPPILLALTFHEYAHAYMAYRYGDDTARQSGRLTLNPLRHLDPLGTIMIFIVHFGWAKPVPVNPNRLRNPKKDMLWISAAGPLANMVLALASGLLI
ncbi:MAG: site-2 protease family protein, partial [Desulfobacterales bacterium]|nr:site-2 protease family protein [Desulfobacterales bacterium]